MEGGLKTALSKNYNIITCRHGKPWYIDTKVIYTTGNTKVCLAIVLCRVLCFIYIVLATNR